jgi:hypothetical protein
MEEPGHIEDPMWVLARVRAQELRKASSGLVMDVLGVKKWSVIQLLDGSRCNAKRKRKR